MNATLAGCDTNSCVWGAAPHDNMQSVNKVDCRLYYIIIIFFQVLIFPNFQTLSYNTQLKIKLQQRQIFR